MYKYYLYIYYNNVHFAAAEPVMNLPVEQHNVLFQG